MIRSMPSSTAWILIARILRSQGRKGEVLADLFTETPERFDENSEAWLAPRGFVESAAGRDLTATEPVRTHIRSWWLPVGRNAGRIVLHLERTDTITQAEALAGREVIIPASARPVPEDGSFYIEDLVGTTVFDRDQPIGIVRDVQFPMSPDGSRRLDEAVSLLEVGTPEGDELLIPFAKAYLREADLPNRRILMELPPGLTEINHLGKRTQ